MKEGKKKDMIFLFFISFVGIFFNLIIWLRNWLLGRWDIFFCWMCGGCIVEMIIVCGKMFLCFNFCVSLKVIILFILCLNSINGWLGWRFNFCLYKLVSFLRFLMVDVWFVLCSGGLVVSILYFFCKKVWRGWNDVE